MIYDFEKHKKLNTIIKNHLDRKLNFDSYSNYSTEYKAIKAKEDMEANYQKTRNELIELETNYKTIIANARKQITEKTYPNFLKESSLYDRVFASSEVNNALLAFQIKPDNILDILQSAESQNRPEFIQTLTKLYINDPSINASQRSGFRDFYNDYANKIGTAELENTIESSIDELKDVVKFLECSSSEFEVNAQRVENVAKKMDQAGQLKEENVFTSD